MSQSPTAGRLLRLLSLLQARREWPGSVLAERLDVSPRTIRRDVERLRSLGYPIDSTTGPEGGYKLQTGTAMPPLLLDDEEAIAIAIALSTAARAAVSGVEEGALRALLKLEQVLPAPLRRRVRALGAVSDATPRQAGPEVDAEALTILAGARRDNELVRFRYTGRDGAVSRRMVEPHALVALGRRWYLVAFDPQRAGWRTFRVDRIGSPKAAGRRFHERVIPGGDPAAYVAGSIRGAVYGHRARVHFHAPAAELRRGIGRGWGELEELPDGSCIYETSDEDLFFLAVRLSMAGVDFDVEGPAELYEHLRTLGSRLMAAGSGPGA